MLSLMAYKNNILCHPYQVRLGAIPKSWRGNFLFPLGILGDEVAPNDLSPQMALYFKLFLAWFQLWTESAGVFVGVIGGRKVRRGAVATPVNGF